MPRRIPVLLVAVALASIALVAVAQAQEQSYPALPPPPLSCSAGKATVQATLDKNGMFPHSETCPANSGLEGDCLAWPYTYTVKPGSISSAAMLIDSDVRSYPPNTGVPPLTGIGSGAFDVTQVTFTATGSKVVGTIYTGTNVAPGTVTAVAQVGNTVGSCAIAGPDDVAGTTVGLAPFTTAQTDEFGICQIQLLLDAKGCPTLVTAEPKDKCKVTVETPTITTSEGSGSFLGGTCGSRITKKGSTCLLYCPTSFGSCFQVCY